MKDSDWRILYELYQTPNITKVAEKLFMTQRLIWFLPGRCPWRSF